ncbi:Hypothetical predicted protein [Cloeon dipterum]|uniref:Uncharacterized protein n=1 Tax=Cloeon dipterum TaxID=197152 RepID=A0A8S1E5K3_9INSE|nr:Hypothetical predicted protein [Cloeon dipterum]
MELVSFENIDSDYLHLHEFNYAWNSTVFDHLETDIREPSFDGKYKELFWTSGAPAKVKNSSLVSWCSTNKTCSFPKHFNYTNQKNKCLVLHRAQRILLTSKGSQMPDSDF